MSLVPRGLTLSSDRMCGERVYRLKWSGRSSYVDCVVTLAFLLVLEHPAVKVLEFGAGPCQGQDARPGDAHVSPWKCLPFPSLERS